LQEQTGKALLEKLETERAFEIQILTASSALLLLLALWGVRRGFRHTREIRAAFIRAEKLLESSRGETVLVQRSARFYFWVLDPAGVRFEQVDGEWMILLGRQGEVWTGVEEWAALIHPDDRESAQRMRHGIPAGETRALTFEYRMARADGSFVWVRDLTAMRPGEGGGLHRGFFIDVTEEKNHLEALTAGHDQERAALTAERTRLEEESRQLRENLAATQQELAGTREQLEMAEARLWSILEHAQVAITLKDADGNYLFVNRRFQEWFGVEAGEVRERDDALLFGEAHQVASRQKERQVLEDGASLAGEEVWPLGETRGLFSVARFPLRGAGRQVLGVFTVLVDVTDRKLLEEELLAELQLAKSCARNAGRAQSGLLAAMRREVPSLVRGMQRMIGRLQESGPPARQQVRLDLLAQSVTSLLAVVEELNNGFSRSGAPPGGEDFDLLQLLEESATIFARYAVGAGKRLQGRIAQGVPRGAHGDTERLRRLLAILLGGAIHSGGVGEILFSVQRHPKDGFRILFQVPAGVPGAEREDDLAILERLAVEMGGACRLGQTGTVGAHELISVIVQLAPPVGNHATPHEDEPVAEAM
ncbi:MAG: PAS domain S-box protein, partial [Magnetococcales bacterium]|nr:PAS domain S-box protein [Magnetococcales bacterium]